MKCFYGCAFYACARAVDTPLRQCLVDEGAPLEWDDRAVVSAIDAVKELFACFERDDPAEASRLLAPDALIAIFGSDEGLVELRGFEEFVAWYSRRRGLLGDSFEYKVEELLPGERYAVALITLSRTAEGRRTEWRQVAVYAVEGGVLTELRAYEEPQSRSGRW